MSEPIQDDKWTITPDSIWPWGKHKGTALKDTPIAYLAWVSENFSKSPWKKACQRWIAIHDPERAKRMGIKVDEKLEGGGFVQGRMDCSKQFRPLMEFPGMVEWDGVSAPF